MFRDRLESERSSEEVGGYEIDCLGGSFEYDGCPWFFLAIIIFTLACATMLGANPAIWRLARWLPD